MRRIGLREQFRYHAQANVYPSLFQEVLKNLESHRQPFQQIHRDRSVNGVPVPPEQLQDMAER